MSAAWPASMRVTRCSWTSPASPCVRSPATIGSSPSVPGPGDSPMTLPAAASPEHAFALRPHELGRALYRHARLLKGVAGLVLFFALWQLSVPLVGLSEYFYPSPRRVAAAFVELIEKGLLPVYVLDSLGRYLSSVGIGTLIGVTLGLLIGLNRAVSRALGPLINFMYAIVEGAWIPLFVVWWGYGFKVIIVLLVYIMVFPLLYNTIVGVRAIPQIYINAVRALGASPLQVLGNVILPAALPNMITGFRVGAGFAFRGLIFAEMLAAKTGIGYLIY